MRVGSSSVERGVSKMVLMERDYEIMREIERWRYCLSRHIKVLAGFEGQRACDRRLKILKDAGYIERKMILYGVPGVYSLTYKGKMLIGANKRQDKIRVEQITHDIAVLDTAVYFTKRYKVKPEEITTDKELNSRAGFGERKRRPDFVIEQSGKKYCVEIELSPKSAVRFEKIVSDNYLEYRTQFWIVEKTGLKIRNMLEEYKGKYNNIKIIELEGVQEVVRNNK